MSSGSEITQREPAAPVRMSKQEIYALVVGVFGVYVIVRCAGLLVGLVWFMGRALTETQSGKDPFLPYTIALALAAAASGGYICFRKRIVVSRWLAGRKHEDTMTDAYWNSPEHGQLLAFCLAVLGIYFLLESVPELLRTFEYALAWLRKAAAGHAPSLGWRYVRVEMLPRAVLAVALIAKAGRIASFIQRQSAREAANQSVTAG